MIPIIRKRMTKTLIFRVPNLFHSVNGYYTDLLSVWRTVFDRGISLRNRWLWEIRLGRGASEGGRTIYIGYNLFDYLGKSTRQYGKPCWWASRYDHIHPRFVIRGWGKRAILQVGCTAIIDDMPVVDELMEWDYNCPQSMASA